MVYCPGCLPQLLLGPLLNTFSQLNPYEKEGTALIDSLLSVKKYLNK